MPDEAQAGRRAVVGDVPRIPARLLLAAAELAESRESRHVSEAHLVHALLQHSHRLVDLLGRLQVPVSVLGEHIALHLDVAARPEAEVAHRPDGGREIYSLGMVQLIEGRATVLAAAPEQHRVDAVDVFVSALFDPKSLTTYATAVVAGVDRDRLLANISDRLRRYAGITFPPSRVAHLAPPVRVDWSRRDDALRVLTSEVGTDVFWSYTKVQDDMVVYSESEHVLDVLVSRGITPGAPGKGEK